jgi:hypothetical protein
MNTEIHSSALLGLLLALACSSNDGDDSTPPSGASESTGDASSDVDPSVAQESTVDGVEPSDSTDADTASTTSPADDTGADPIACRPVAPPCEDQLVLDLSLVDASSEGEVSNTADGSGWRSEVDARAGGLQGASMNPWIYLRFGDDGLERVELDDFEALESEAWHIAAKRFGIRLNSGVSGPSCVAAAPVFDLDYTAIAERPPVITALESFYDDACNLLDDGMGLGAPGYLLTPWWTYPGCVATTGTPFVIDLPDGRSLKFVVESYYASGQQQCNDDGAMGADAGRFVWRWQLMH